MLDSDAAIAQALTHAKLTSSGWWVAPCPFCQWKLGTPGRGKKLGIRDDSGLYHCFRCHTVGKLRTADARTLVSLAKKADRTEATRAPEGFYELAGDDSMCLEEAHAYLRKRGVSPEVAAQARIGACIKGKYAGRVVVPVLDAQASGWLGFVARTWGPKDQCDVPYLYPAGMDRANTMYGAQALDVVTEVPLVVVEGVFDTFPFWPDGVALFGSVSEPQIEALSIAQRPVAVVLDGDAWREGWALAMRLRLEGQRAGAIVLPPRTDPDEVPASAIRAAAWECIEDDGALVRL